MLLSPSIVRVKDLAVAGFTLAAVQSQPSRAFLGDT